MALQNKIVCNIEQNLSPEEKATARRNIGVYSTEQVDAIVPHKPMIVSLGASIYRSAPIIDTQTSGTVLSDLGNLPNPIQLDAGKTYLIQPSVVGTSDYTLARTHNQSNRFSIELQLAEADITTESYLIFGTTIPIAVTQFCLNTTHGSNQSGYRFITTIGSQPILYTPDTDKTFTKIVVVNNGNVLGGDGSTRCWMDFQLGSLIITEV